MRLGPKSAGFHSRNYKKFFNFRVKKFHFLEYKEFFGGVGFFLFFGSLGWKVRQVALYITNEIRKNNQTGCFSWCEHIIQTFVYIKNDWTKLTSIAGGELVSWLAESREKGNKNIKKIRNTNQLNTIYRIFVPMKVSVRPAKIYTFVRIACKLTHISYTNNFIL